MVEFDERRSAHMTPSSEVVEESPRLSIADDASESPSEHAKEANQDRTQEVVAALREVIRWEAEEYRRLVGLGTGVLQHT